MTEREGGGRGEGAVGHGVKGRWRRTVGGVPRGAHLVCARRGAVGGRGVARMLVGVGAGEDCEKGWGQGQGCCKGGGRAPGGVAWYVALLLYVGCTWGVGRETAGRGGGKCKGYPTCSRQWCSPRCVAVQRVGEAGRRRGGAHCLSPIVSAPTAPGHPAKGHCTRGTCPAHTPSLHH